MDGPERHNAKQSKSVTGGKILHGSSYISHVKEPNLCELWLPEDMRREIRGGVQ